MWNQYFIVANFDEALDIISNAPEESKIVAGATDLMLEVKRGMRNEISTLVDISRIPDLDEIIVDPSGNIHIGAMVTHNQIASSEIIQNKATCLAEASYQVGSPQIRNRGTVAGNLLTASPANDTIPSLIALQAKVVLVSKTGQRTLRVESLFKGVRKTVVEKNEILREIIIPESSTHSISSFYKHALRNAQAISLVNAAVSVKVENQIVTGIVIAVGAVAPTVIRVKSLESSLIGMNIYDLDKYDDSLVTKEIHPISDIRSSDGYRYEMARMAIKRCLHAIMDPVKRYISIPAHPVTLSTKAISKTLSPIETCRMDEKNPIITTINGQNHSYTGKHQKSLLDLIRDDTGLIGSKEGCAEGECGACTIHMDGKAIMSCLVPAPRAHQAEIITIEGITEGENLHPIQEAFISEGAVQCGYCSPGFIMSAVKLLEERPHPEVSEIKEAITGNLCRCTGYYKIIRAIEKAAESGG